MLRRTRSSTFPARRCLPKQVCQTMPGFHSHLQFAGNLDLLDQLCHHWASRARSPDVHLTSFHHSLPVIWMCYLRTLGLINNKCIMKRFRFHLLSQQECKCIFCMRHLWGWRYGVKHKLVSVLKELQVEWDRVTMQALSSKTHTLKGRETGVQKRGV